MRPEAKTYPEAFLANFAFPMRARFYPLGFPLSLETNSADVMQAAQEGWGKFAAQFDEPEVRMSLGVWDRDELSLPVEPRVVAQEHLITSVWNDSAFVVCDLRNGFAFGWLTRNLAADHPFLRYRFLHAFAMNMLVHKFLAPVHGALVARNGQGVLLCGDSLAGKSTLAYACARAGWTHLADDGTYLIRGREDRYAIAYPHYIHLRADAPALFPELKDHAIAVRPNGKIGMELSTSALGFQTANACAIAHVVFLSRGASGGAHLAPYPKAAALEWFGQYLNYGEACVLSEQRETLRNLLDAGLWEMRYAGLERGVRRLQELAGGGS